nr:26S proteasome non-ATPase regulatory subunit 10-like [Marmota flaviventris]
MTKPENANHIRDKADSSPSLFQVLYIFAPYSKKNLVLVKSPSQCLIETRQWGQNFKIILFLLSWTLSHSPPRLAPGCFPGPVLADSKLSSCVDSEITRGFLVCVSNWLVCNPAYSEKLEEFKERILAYKSLATRTGQDSRTALHWLISAGHTEIVEFLLHLGVPVNDKEDAGRSPLNIAASAGRDEIIKALLGKGAHVNATNQNGYIPLHCAASKNRREIAAVFLEGGPNPDAHYEATAMHEEAAKGNLKTIHSLLYYKASTNIQDTEGNTPLHLACERVEEAKLLGSQGASIYIENEEEKTPLQGSRGGLGLILKTMVEG